jgi:hypothetical protein
MHKLVTSALTMVLLFPPVLAAQGKQPRDGKARLSGVVIDSISRAPIANAIVRVDGTNRATATDSAGRYVLDDLPKGPLWVDADRLGYRGAMLDVRLTADDSIEIALAPKPDVLPFVDEIMGQLTSRRRRSQASVQAFQAPQLVGTPTDLRRFLISLAGPITPCPQYGAAENCVRSNRGYRLVRVFIDDMLFAGAQLERYQPYDFELVEYYTRSAVLRLYTPDFLERVARGKAFISPQL